MSRDREGSAPVSEGGEPRGEAQDGLRDLGRRLDALGARLARVERALSPDATRAAGEPREGLFEREREHSVLGPRHAGDADEVAVRVRALASLGEAEDFVLHDFRD